MSRDRSPIEDLRLAIDCLPARTRQAMLEGIRSSDIIVGAYADRAGGVCPMLAAHRCGGRTSFVSFAHAWDRFAGARRARRATARELRILDGQLEASLLAEERAGVDLGTAIADHEALRTARERHAFARPTAPREQRRNRWAWLRPGHRAAEDERALRRLERELAALRDGAVGPDGGAAKPPERAADPVR